MRTDPILLTGVYRSGTTILSCMLGAHPFINFTYGSVNYLRWFVKKQVDPENYKEIVTRTKTRLSKRYNKEINEKNIIDEVESFDGKITHATIYSSIMHEFFQDKDIRWGEKTLLEWTNIPSFLDMYPDSKALHIIRDPRDVIASFKGMTFEPGQRYLDAIFACMHSMDSCLYYQMELPKDRYYVVNYEELIGNPKENLIKICSFLDLDYNESMMDPSLYKDQFGDQLNKASHTSFKDNNKAPIGRWKEHLSNSDVSIIESLLSNQMKKFNYQNLSNNQGSIQEFLNIFNKEPLLRSRLIHYLNTGEGCEEYPSDPTKEENWTVLGKKDKGASSLYLRNKR